MTQNKKSPGENQWLQDPHETREIGSAEVFGSIDFTCDLKNWGRPPRAPVWIGLLEDKNSMVFGPAESLRRLLIGREGRRGIWWPGEDDEEATEKEIARPVRIACVPSMVLGIIVHAIHWHLALARDGSITLSVLTFLFFTFACAD